MRLIRRFKQARFRVARQYSRSVNRTSAIRLDRMLETRNQSSRETLFQLYRFGNNEFVDQLANGLQIFGVMSKRAQGFAVRAMSYSLEMPCRIRKLLIPQVARELPFSMSINLASKASARVVSLYYHPISTVIFVIFCQSM